MKKWLEKMGRNRFRIQGRRDWTVFWIFAVLICYGTGLRFAGRNEDWLFQFANPYMSDLNQPHSWGQLMGTLFLLAAVAEAVLFLCKKPIKARVLVLAGALFIPAVLVLCYRMHTNLIVSPLWEEEPADIRIHYSIAGQDSAPKSNNADLTGEQREELLELCRTLERVSGEETQKELLLWYRENSDRILEGEDTVSLRFSEKYGHSYSVRFAICEGKIFFWRGYSFRGQEITFFEDNGLIGWMEKMKSKAL